MNTKLSSFAAIDDKNINYSWDKLPFHLSYPSFFLHLTSTVIGQLGHRPRFVVVYMLVEQFQKLPKITAAGKDNVETLVAP